MLTARELKQWEQWKQEVLTLRGENQHLRLELMACRPALYQAGRKIERLEERLARLEAENRKLKRQLAERTPPAAPVPAFVKVRRKHSGRHGRPGRRVGHEGDFRPMPAHIDQTIDVPLPKDEQGQRVCPHHGVPLRDVQEHRRVVEDLVPATVRVTCYGTVSGYCPVCDQYVESRHPEQPPPADVPQPQLGLNTLATVAVLRTHHRLPYGQIVGVLQGLSTLKVCPGGVARQLQRMGRWFDGEYGHLKRYLRSRKVIGADETGWPMNGKPWWLWTITAEQHTLYHVDKSRGRKVIQGLLGQGFDGWLVSDFLSAYNQASPRQQKCLTHLARDLHETAEAHPEFGHTSFCRRLGRLLKDMVKLKHRRRRFTAKDYERRVQRVEQRLEELSQMQSPDEQVQRLAGRLRRYASSLTPFLRVAELPGDNNHTERQIRPMAVLRKITGGSRSERGAQATATVASLVRTAVQKGLDAVSTVKTLLMHVWAGGKTPILTPDIGPAP